MNNQLLLQLQEKIGQEKVVTGKEVQERYHHIWHMHEPLQALAVCLPRSTQEVSEVMKICYELQQPVVVHGGLTNLVGSTETTANEVVISMEKLNKIEEVDRQNRTMTVQAGVVLENIHQKASEKALLFPLSYGAKGSAQIGGAISTNAGGLRVFRFGMTRNLVLGLEAVLADGTIVSSMKKVIKDNSAYDLKQLFIGSEGTLGIVTKAVLKLVEAPKSRNSAFIGINSYEKVIQLLKFLDAGLAGTLSGYELIWNNTYRAMTAPIAEAKPPLPHDYTYYVLVESLGSDQEKDHQALQNLLEQALETEIIEDAVMAHSVADLAWFWTIREDVRVIIAQCQNIQLYDVSLPIPLIGEYVEETIKKLHQIPAIEKVFILGHVADGNIHFTVSKTAETTELMEQVNRTIYEPLQAIGGSVSAEHGIGVHKKKYLALSRNPAEIQLMRTLKETLDPLNILNRGKVLGVK